MLELEDAKRNIEETGWQSPKRARVHAAVAESVKSLTVNLTKGRSADARAVKNAVATAFGGAVGEARAGQDGVARAVEKAYGVERRALAKGKKRRRDWVEDENSSLCLLQQKRPRGERVIKQEVLDAIEVFAKEDKNATRSPRAKDTLKVKRGGVVKHIPRYFRERKLVAMWEEFVKRPQHKALGRMPGFIKFSTTIGSFRWLRARKTAAQRQVCCCVYHTGAFAHPLSLSKFICVINTA